MNLAKKFENILVDSFFLLFTAPLHFENFWDFLSRNYLLTKSCQNGIVSIQEWPKGTFLVQERPDICLRDILQFS